ncbi:MAG: ABC transporter permease subunit [Hungatella hathewayi]|nr:ABC transporter permease subunit [Hungatella hathewayi]
MSGGKAMASSKSVAGGKKKGLLKNLMQYREYYIMLIPGFLFFLIFCYGPMYGLVIAFQDYYPLKGISGSAFVGLKHFKSLFSNPFFISVLKNTLIISVYKLLICFPAPIFLCLVLNEIKSVRFKKIAQSVSYLPPSRGPVNILLQNLGFNSVFFVAEPKYFRGVLVASDMWKSIGWGSIVYLAAVTAIDPSLYEAAEMDGAGRIRKILHITFPALVPIVTVMLIMESGKILNDSFEQVYNFLTPTTYGVGDVISTFVYRMGIQNMQYSFTTAVDLFKNIISFLLVMLTNYVARRTNDYALW